MVIAIDYDDTMTIKSAYPEAGEFRPHCIEAIKNFQKHGIKCYLWTCRQGPELETAKKAIESQGLIMNGYNVGFYDYVNWGARKPIADIYIDDRSFPWVLWNNSIDWVLIEHDILQYYELLKSREKVNNSSGEERIQDLFSCLDALKCQLNKISSTKGGSRCGK